MEQKIILMRNNNDSELISYLQEGWTVKQISASLKNTNGSSLGERKDSFVPVCYVLLER